MRAHALRRQCLEPGCRGHAQRGSRCPRHTRVWVGGQPSSAYGSGWPRLRAQVLAEEAQCRSCGALSTEVDHIVPLAAGGTHDRRNLRALCHGCHVTKTASDSRAGKARKARGVISSLPTPEQRSARRCGLRGTFVTQWQSFFDATLERRLTHAPDPVLARHVANLSLISGPSGLRPDLDVAQGQPIAAALGAMIAYDGVTRVEPVMTPYVGSPTVW